MTKTQITKPSCVYVLARGLFKILFSIAFPLKIKGTQHLPEQGPAIVCANHISLMDPIVLGIILKPPVRFMAKKELFQVPLLGLIIKQLGAFPVSRGQVDRKAIKQSLEALDKGQIFGIFPEGTRKNKSKKPLRGVGFLTAKSRAPVIPVAIKGPYKLFRPLVVEVHPPVKYDQEQYETYEDPMGTFSQKIMDTIYQIECDKF